MWAGCRCLSKRCGMGLWRPARPEEMVSESTAAEASSTADEALGSPRTRGTLLLGKSLDI